MNAIPSQVTLTSCECAQPVVLVECEQRSMQSSPGRHCTLVISIGPVPTPNLGLGELIALPQFT